MYELQKNEEINKLIEITKSNSGISGAKLWETHQQLGLLMAEQLKTKISNPQDTTVIAILRSGLPFAIGIYVGLNCKFNIYNPKLENFNSLQITTKDIILVDAVINTGKSMQKILNNIDEQFNIKLCTCVINNKAISIFDNYEIYAVRISNNYYIGSNQTTVSNNKRPDTTMRLFNLL